MIGTTHHRRNVDALKATLLMGWALICNPFILIPPFILLALSFALHFFSLHLPELIPLNLDPGALNDRQRLGMHMLYVTPLAPLIFLIPLYCCSACIVAHEKMKGSALRVMAVISALASNASRTITIFLVSILRAIPLLALLAGGAAATYHFRAILIPLANAHDAATMLATITLAVVIFFTATPLVITPFVALAGNLSVSEAAATSRFVISRKLGGILVLLSLAGVGCYLHLAYGRPIFDQILDPLFRRYAEIAFIATASWFLCGVLYMLSMNALDQIATAHLSALRATIPVRIRDDDASPADERTNSQLPDNFLIEGKEAVSSQPRTSSYFSQTSWRNSSRPEPTR